MTTQLWVLVVCAVIGILDTAYLIYHKFAGTDVACPFFPKEWCHTVQHSPQSKTFGIPNSMAGFVMYALILAFTLGYGAGSMPFWPLQAIVAFGFLFSMYFLYVQGFVLRAFCTWCVVSAINFIVMSVAIFLY
jgi:uncharacterized membrane protein